MILYIGNKLSKYGNTPTSVETLGALLAEEFELVCASDKQNKLLRLADMLGTIVRHRKQTDLVLIDTYSTSNFYYALFTALLCRLLDIGYIPILHGGNLPHRLKKNPLMCQAVFGHSIVNVAPSGYLYDVFKKAGYHVEYIPNSLEIDRYVYKEREQLRPKLLYVRALSKVYNPEMAIKVLAMLVPLYPDAKLCIVGPDKDGTLADVKALAKALGVEKHVQFTGKMDKSEWIALSEEYDIFINTASFDNTPVSVMEAMALGLPVVSTNVGGIPYLVEDGNEGLLVNKDDVKAMVEKIIRLLSTPVKAKKIAQKARKKVEGFSDPEVKRRWKELMKKYKGTENVLT